MKKYDIVIATPGSMLTAAYVRSLTKTIKVLEDQGISWTYVNYESCYIRQAREAIINDSYHEDLTNQVPFSGNFDYKKIMWIDSDIEWQPEHILSLYHSDRDIITGAYMMTSGKIAVSFDEKSSPYPNQIPTCREVQVSSCGFGFICVKKGIFENIPKPWFDSATFEIDGRTMTAIGEDTSWCLKVEQNGYKIWLNPNVRVIHNKTMALAWND
jgi:hypothetical protein